MGMYNELNKINQSINAQSQQLETKSTKKYKVENNLLIKLEYFIKKYKNNGKDIYNINVQDEIIQKALYSCFGELATVPDISTASKFVENYILKDERIDTDYYYIYCMRHYLQCCRNVQNYIKYSNTQKDDTKTQLAMQKLELQRQKLQLQIEKEKQKIEVQTQKANLKQQKEAEKIKQRQAQQTQQAINLVIEFVTIFIKIMMFFMFLPFIIFGIVSLSSIGIASSTSKKRRF